MKILIAADLHWPTINGVATFSRNLARGLAENGHEVLVIAPSQRRSGRGYEEEDGPYSIKRTVSVPFPLYQNYRISVTPRREVRKIMKDFQPDVVHIQMLLGIGQAVMHYSKKMEVPVVSTNHAIPENLMENIRFLAPVSRPINYVITEYGARFHSKADYLTMPTQAAIDMLTAGREVLPDIPIEAVSNGVDLSRFTAKPASAEIYTKFRIPRRKAIISYVGRLDAEKHVSVLLDSFCELKKVTKKPIHLLIVGAGTDSDDLRNQMFELGLADDITFTGRVTDDEIMMLHRVTDIFCMPSPAELQCIAALESMASGKPIVAVDVGAVKELCQNERNGYLCEKDNVTQITASLLRLVEDKAMRLKFGKQSLVIAKKHDIANTLKSYEKIYKKIIAQNSSK